MQYLKSIKYISTSTLSTQVEPHPDGWEAALGGAQRRSLLNFLRLYLPKGVAAQRADKEVAAAPRLGGLPTVWDNHR